MIFFVGWDQPNDGPSGVCKFEHCMISINRLSKRKSRLRSIQNWILDSGAYSRIVSGRGHLSTQKYAKFANFFRRDGNLMAVVAQDYLCSADALCATGLTVGSHQSLSINRYLKLRGMIDAYVMPTLQGKYLKDYVNHIEQYGDILEQGCWVGVGSLARRKPEEIENILLAIKQTRSDLKLHGFGVRKKALLKGSIRQLLYSSDSHGTNKFQGSHSPDKAISYFRNIQNSPCQLSLLPLTVGNP